MVSGAGYNLFLISSSSCRCVKTLQIYTLEFLKDKSIVIVTINMPITPLGNKVITHSKHPKEF